MKRRFKKIAEFLITVGLMAIGASVLFLVSYMVVTIIMRAGRSVADALKLRPAAVLNAETPAEGVGRIPAVVRYRNGETAGEAETAQMLEMYTEGQTPVPAWYRPDEPMAAEWVASSQQVTDAGCPDWNLCTSLIGWDGHMMEVWEMDLFIRILYLEFWGCSEECVKAGADSILQLWNSEYFGRTIFETLSAVAEDGSFVYSPYAYVWEWDYDADGLSEIRQICEDRFFNGPKYSAPFFRLWYYHDWAIPCYEIDGVYFSTFSY